MDDLLLTRIREQEIFKEITVTELEVQKLITEIEVSAGIQLKSRHYNYIINILRFDKILKENATKLCYNVN